MIKLRFSIFCRYTCILVCLVLALTLTACETKSNKAPPSAENRLFYSDYSLSLLKQWVDIDTFISAEMLQSRFGEFTVFHFSGKRKIYPYSGRMDIAFYTDAYHYIFSANESSKYMFGVSVEKLESDGVVRYLPQEEDNGPADNVDPKDLRTAGSPGSYRLGDIEYVYGTGVEGSTLAYVQWTENGYLFRIYPYLSQINDGFYDNKFIAQLLSEETAEEAVADFNRDISRSLLWGRIYRNWLPWIVPVLIAASATTTCLLLRRKRKRKAAAAVVTDSGEMSKEE